MDRQEIKGAIAAVLFIAGEAVEITVFSKLLGVMPDMLEDIFREMEQEAQERQDGICLTRINDKVQLCTNKKYAQYIKDVFDPKKSVSLSASALETLSIIAYRQPVTRSEIDDIRGVHCNYAVSALIEKGLVMEAGRKDVLGRPALLVTSDQFLRHFGLQSLEQLPQIDFEALENEAQRAEDGQDKAGMTEKADENEMQEVQSAAGEGERV